MKKHVPLLAILCTLLCIANPVGAATEQGLEWGFQASDRFDFHFEYVDHLYPVYSKEFDFYIEVASLSAIPDGIGGMVIPYLNVSCSFDYYFDNGTAMGSWSMILPGLAVPVGNWSLWTGFIVAMEHPTADSFSYQVTQSDFAWSYIISYGGEDQPAEQGSATYLKSDGVMTWYDWKGWNAEETLVFEYHITRDGYEGGLPAFLVPVGVIGVAAVVVVIVLIKRR